MAALWETLAVGAVVGGAVLWAWRGLWRAAREKKVCSTCGSSGDCPLVNGKGFPRRDAEAPQGGPGQDCGGGRTPRGDS